MTGVSSSILLAVRSLLWAMVLPGCVAFLVPWRYFGLANVHWDAGSPNAWLGLLSFTAGTAILGACIVEFARSGRATLSPLDPPHHLVARGLYRYVRNPMYLGVSLVILGEAAYARSSSLLLYWTIWFTAAHLFVVACEEPVLRQQFGRSYDDYMRSVPRWIPTLPRGRR
jgi:protein-S-isoprenylcysteine O-methyltransferase Ste14